MKTKKKNVFKIELRRKENEKDNHKENAKCATEYYIRGMRH